MSDVIPTVVSKGEVPALSTQLLHARLDDATVAAAHPAVTPLFQNSAFEADSTFFYSRKANPNCVELENCVSLLEGTAFTVSVPTGMAAISLLLSQLRPGSKIVVHPTMYGCSLKLFRRMAERYNFALDERDLTTAQGIDGISADCSLVFFETPTNPFLKCISIADVSAAAKKKNPSVIVAIDNTWATPLRQRPLHLGADVSIHSGTKYFSGHSDVMGGFISANRASLFEALREERFYQGAVLDPHSAWLLRRSLQTLSLRFDAQEKTCRQIAGWLGAREEIERVYYNGAGGEFAAGIGGILFFQFKPQYEQRYTEFRDRLKIFNTGTGMACVTSMVAQPWSGSHASLDDAEKIKMGINRGLVRLCFGLECASDLRRDLADALESLHPQAARKYAATPTANSDDSVAELSRL